MLRFVSSELFPSDFRFASVARRRTEELFRLSATKLGNKRSIYDLPAKYACFPPSLTPLELTVLVSTSPKIECMPSSLTQLMKRLQLRYSYPGAKSKKSTLCCSWSRLLLRGQDLETNGYSLGIAGTGQRSNSAEGFNFLLCFEMRIKKAFFANAHRIFTLLGRKCCAF